MNIEQQTRLHDETEPETSLCLDCLHRFPEDSFDQHSCSNDALDVLGIYNGEEFKSEDDVREYVETFMSAEMGITNPTTWKHFADLIIEGRLHCDFPDDNEEEEQD